MTKIELTLKTPDSDVEFEVVVLDKKFHVFNKIIDYHGKHKTIRIGQTCTWPDVLNIARIFTGKQVLEIKGTALQHH